MALPYRIIEPQSPEYRQVISTAIKANDIETLSALRGNAGKLIHLVNNWFCYAMMRSGWEPDGAEPDEVVIYTPETRNDMIRAFEQIG